jgi:hypothetical protein
MASVTTHKLSVLFVSCCGNDDGTAKHYGVEIDAKRELNMHPVSRYKRPPPRLRERYRLNPITAKNSTLSPRRMPEGSTARIAARTSRSNACVRSPRILRVQNDIE